MSNRRDPRAASALDEMTGHRMPGGCDDCGAYQLMTKQTAGVYLLIVHHDESCPYLGGVTAARGTCGNCPASDDGCLARQASALRQRCCHRCTHERKAHEHE